MFARQKKSYLCPFFRPPCEGRGRAAASLPRPPTSVSSAVVPPRLQCNKHKKANFLASKVSNKCTQLCTSVPNFVRSRDERFKFRANTELLPSVSHIFLNFCVNKRRKYKFSCLPEDPTSSPLCPGDGSRGMAHASKNQLVIRTHARSEKTTTLHSLHSHLAFARSISSSSHV